MHQGVTPGSHPIDFNTFATSLFQETVIPKYIEFLKCVHRKHTSGTFHYSELIKSLFYYDLARSEREEKYGLPPNTDMPTDTTSGENNVDDSETSVNGNNETSTDTRDPSNTSAEGNGETMHSENLSRSTSSTIPDVGSILHLNQNLHENMSINGAIDNDRHGNDRHDDGRESGNDMSGDIGKCDLQSLISVKYSP